MSNFFKKTKRAWEENEYDALHAKRNQYPLTEQECFLTSEPMFDGFKLREAYDYFISHNTKGFSAANFFDYLLRLEKDVPFNKQKCYP